MGLPGISDIVRNPVTNFIADRAREVVPEVTKAVTPAVSSGLSMAETLASRTGTNYNPYGGYGHYSGAGGVNAAEIGFAIRHPVEALQFRADSQTALAEAQNRFPPDTLHNGEGDAFRHAYWNALMTKHGGANLAQQAADAHEENGGPANEKAMDLHNNAVGRQIALENPYASEAELANLVETALREGRLQTAP